MESNIFEAIDKPHDLVQIISPFFEYKNILIVITASHILHTFSKKNPKFKLIVLSIMLDSLTIKYAEIEGMRIMCKTKETND